MCMPIEFKDNAKSKKLQREAILEVPLSSQNDVRTYATLNRFFVQVNEVVPQGYQEQTDDLHTFSLKITQKEKQESIT